MFDRNLAISLNVHNPEGCVGTLMTGKHAESIGLRTQVLTWGDRQISYVEPDTQENWNHLEQSLCSTYNLTIWKNGGGSWAWLVFESQEQKQRFIAECGPQS
jgi:hypothetical protein